MTSPLDLAPSVVAGVALAAVALAVLALALATVAVVRLRRLRRDYSVLQAGDDAESFVDVVRRKTTEVDALRRRVETNDDSVQRLSAQLHDAIRHVAVVRYDAFNDMGGRMSFSAALLDDHGDGLVVTSINGRSETRTYAKGVKGQASDATLSPEEQQVISFARATNPS